MLQVLKCASEHLAWQGALLITATLQHDTDLSLLWACSRQVEEHFAAHLRQLVTLLCVVGQMVIWSASSQAEF